jgi:hypothetical protein
VELIICIAFILFDQVEILNLEDQCEAFWKKFEVVSGSLTKSMRVFSNTHRMLQKCAHQLVRMAKENAKEKLPSMRIELISEDIYSFAEVTSEYETSVLTVKLRGRIRAVASLIRGVPIVCKHYVFRLIFVMHAQARNHVATRR